MLGISDFKTQETFCPAIRGRSGVGRSEFKCGDLCESYDPCHSLNIDTFLHSKKG